MPIHHQLMALIVAFIWGTNFVLIKIGLDELPPFLFVALRFFFVAFPLVFIFPKPKAKWLHIATYGTLIGFGQFGLLFWAMQGHITPGLAALVIQLQVFFTILLAVWLFEERLKGKQLRALMISGAGLCLIFWHTGGNTTAIGLTLVLVAALSWAMGNSVVKQVGKVNIVSFIVWSSLFAVPPLLLMSFYLEGSALMRSSISNAGVVTWSVVAWQSIGNTLIGYGLWNMLLDRYNAVQVTPWALLVPVFGLAASHSWLGEPLQWWKLVAAGLILCGLAMNMIKAKPDRAV